MHARHGRFVAVENPCRALIGHSRRVFKPDTGLVRAILPWAVCLIVAAEGCQGTRLPNLVPTPYDSDKRSFNVHDPLPETGIGPDMGARPPGFLQERSEPRRTQEAQELLGVPPGGTNNAAPGPMGGPPPGAPLVPAPGGPGMPSSQLYPDAVPR
jgi:hypothetical protein